MISQFYLRNCGQLCFYIIPALSYIVFERRVKSLYSVNLRLWQNKLLNLKSKSKLNEKKITFFSAESFDFIWLYHALVTCYKIMSTHTKIISNFSFTVNIQFPWILGIQMTGLILLAVKSKSGTKLNDFKNDFYTCCRKTHMFVHLKLYPKYSFIKCTKFWDIFLINFYGLYML